MATARGGARNGAIAGHGAATIRERNEARILEAAEAVFAEAGFHGATTAEIALRAGLPKANVHYYFATKEAIYRSVIDRILGLWLEPLKRLEADQDPAAALKGYIGKKLELSRSHPLASRLFAMEILRGAPVIRDFLEGELRELVDAKARVVEHWIAEGRLRPVDPWYLFFTLWASTQHLADFEAQILAVEAKPALGDDDFERARRTLEALVIGGLVRDGRDLPRGQGCG